MLIALLFACTSDSFTDSDGSWYATEGTVWTVTDITDENGEPGIHPWGLTDDCGADFGTNCVTCLELDPNEGVLRTWTARGGGEPDQEVGPAYTDNGSIISYVLGDPDALDGEHGAEWWLNLEPDRYDRRIVDMWGAGKLQDRMWLENGCPFAVE